MRAEMAQPYTSEWKPVRAIVNAYVHRETGAVVFGKHQGFVDAAADEASASCNWSRRFVRSSRVCAAAAARADDDGCHMRVRVS